MNEKIIILKEKELFSRPSWDEYFMKIAISISSRASCFKVQAGSVLVKDNRIIGTGYNGAPGGIRSCLDLGECEKEKITGEDYLVKTKPQTCRGMHSETNAIAYSIRETEGATLYVTVFPCNDCAKHIISNKIKRIVFKKPYNENEYGIALDKLLEAGIEVCRLDLSLKRALAIDFISPNAGKVFGVWNETEENEIKKLIGNF